MTIALLCTLRILTIIITQYGNQSSSLETNKNNSIDTNRGTICRTMTQKKPGESGVIFSTPSKNIYPRQKRTKPSTTICVSTHQ